MALYLMGGGSPELQRPVTTAVFEGAENALYLPFASSPKDIDGAQAWFKGTLRDAGVQTALTTWKTFDGHSPEELEDFDLVYVGGGSPGRVAKELDKPGWRQALVRWVKSGRTYFGDSAGALAACGPMDVAAGLDDDPLSVGARGLGLLQDLSIIPHSDVFPAGAAAAWAGEHGVEVLEIPEGAAVAIPEGVSRPSVQEGSLRALGTGGVALVRPDGSREPVPLLDQ